MSLPASLTTVLERLQSLFARPTSPSQTYAVGLSTAVALGALWVVYDKHSWAAFGTGGTPPTWAGYWRANVKFRVLRFLSFDDLRDTRPLNKHATSKSYLDGALPARSGPRPAVNAWTLPQRQQRYQSPTTTPEKGKDVDSQRQQEQLLARLHGLVDRLVDAHGDVLLSAPSNTEGRTIPAVYARPDLPGRDATARDRIAGDEIAHVHRQEHSLHVFLSEADAAEVVAKGWGERFPLSSLGMVHPGWSFVYAPTSEDELAVVERIVAAGVRYLTGRQV